MRVGAANSLAPASINFSAVSTSRAMIACSRVIIEGEYHFVHEILALLKPGDYVLDLGSRTGSFPALATCAKILRLDLNPGPTPNHVQGDATRLPFRSGSVAAVIANHSFEHIDSLDDCLVEIRRVLRPSCAFLYVAVPDSTTVSDRIYRWLSHGGGHVNPIDNAEVFAARLKQSTGLELAATRTLHTSFAFANRLGPVRWSRRINLLGGGYEWGLRQASIMARLSDAWFGTRWSVYGWAFYLGRMYKPDETASTNVCIRCGAGHVSEWLLAAGVVRQGWFSNYFTCPACGASNGFTRDAIRPGE